MGIGPVPSRHPQLLLVWEWKRLLFIDWLTSGIVCAAEPRYEVPKRIFEPLKVNLHGFLLCVNPLSQLDGYVLLQRVDEPESVADYCWKGHLVTADQHRSFYEAVNHRMWDITSGFTEWKINSCYPDVQWQNFDYYHKPMVSQFYIKRACEPLHVQLNLVDNAVSVVNPNVA
ncbi:MAG: hypothetical protein ABSF26_15570 [Thermoguttaceae bacterium]|jgi:hypothetical protein